MSSVPGSVLPRLAAALAARTSPVVLVLDDVHLLHNSECRAALSVLADHVPVGSRLVLAGRAEPPLRVARLRAEGKITEIGPRDLSLTRKEASALLRAAELVVGEDEVAELHRRTEGWAAGLYLAALAIREGGVLAVSSGALSGSDRFVREYVESEFLARISEQQRAFLTRTAVLERISGPLCEAVLELPGSAATLADLARSNLLLVPLDRQGRWYRYHHLFRDMLLAELERLQLGLIPVLRRRAAAWCLQNGMPEEAMEYPKAAGDVGLAAQLVEKLWHPIYQQGRIATLQRWFQWLDGQGGIEGHPLAAVFASLTAGAIGREAGRGRAVGRRGRSLAAPDRGLGPATRPPRHGPPCSALGCAAAGWSRCAPTPRRPHAGSRQRESCRQERRSWRGPPASFAVTSRAATCYSRMPSASGTRADPTSERTYCASGRWWR